MFSIKDTLCFKYDIQIVFERKFDKYFSRFSIYLKQDFQVTNLDQNQYFN